MKKKVRRVDLWINELLREAKCTLRQLFERGRAWAIETFATDLDEVDTALRRYRERGSLVGWMRSFVYQCQCGRCAPT